MSERRRFLKNETPPRTIRSPRRRGGAAEYFLGNSDGKASAVFETYEACSDAEQASSDEPPAAMLL